MRNGFKFKGRHSSEFGVTVRTKSRPIIPSVKAYTMDLPYRDGEYDFSASNPQGREHYNNRTFTLSLGITANTLSGLQTKLGKLSLWLSGRGELIFDDLPLVVWRGRISDEIIYMPEHGGTKAVMEVSITASPFGENIFGTEGPRLGDPVMLDSDIPLSMEQMYSYKLSGSGGVYIMNFGDRPIRPVITIEGLKGGASLTLGDKSLSFTAYGTVTADFEKQTVTNGSAAVRVSGEFFEFPAGGSTLIIDVSGEPELTVRVEFKPEYMYNADYTDIEWSESDA